VSAASVTPSPALAAGESLMQQGAYFEGAVTN
jgi:hypothetical protein